MARALSITSWFHSPLVTMGSSHEVLSRASCFAVRNLTSRYIVASQHVTSPFRYPAYYPEETHGFVHVLEPEDVRLSIELRGIDGSVLRRVFLRTPPIFEHPSRDVVLIPTHANADLNEMLTQATWSVDTLRNFDENSDAQVRYT
jgi:hypothetical protein